MMEHASVTPVELVRQAVNRLGGVQAVADALTRDRTTVARWLLGDGDNVPKLVVRKLEKLLR